MAWAEQMSSGRYRGRYYDNNGDPQSVIDGKVGFRYKRDAEEAAQEQEVQARRRAAVDAGTQSPSIKWKDLWALYLEKRRRDTETATTFGYIASKYLLPRWADEPANKISRKVIQTWIDKDLVPGHEPSYVHTIYSAFRASIYYAIEEEILSTSPFAKIKLPTIVKKPQPYIDDDYLPSLEGHLKDVYQDVVAFQRETGLRPGELCGLHLHRIDRKLRVFHVVEVYVGRLKVIRPFPKNRKGRDVPLTAKAMEILDRVTEGRDVKRGCGLPHTDGKPCRSDVLFRTVRDKPLHPSNLYSILMRAAERAKVEARSPYAGRRGTATKAADNGLNIFDIAALLGHDPSQTPGYVQQTPEFHKRARVALGDSPQLTVVDGRGARGAHRGADLEKQPPTTTHSADGENAG